MFEDDLTQASTLRICKKTRVTCTYMYVCAHNTSLHYFTNLNFYVSYTSFVNCTGLPIAYCTSCRSLIDKPCLQTLKFKLLNVAKFYVHISPIFSCWVTCATKLLQLGNLVAGLSYHMQYILMIKKFQANGLLTNHNCWMCMHSTYVSIPQTGKDSLG